MGLCKSCNEVKNANSMIDGVCNDCLKDREFSSEKLSEDKAKLVSPNLLTIKDTEFIKYTRALDFEEKKSLLIKIYSKEGYSLHGVTGNTIQLVKKKKFSFLWAILWLFVFGIGILVYLFYYLSKSDTIVSIDINKKFSKQENSVNTKNEFDKTERLIKLNDMLKDNLITQEEFNSLKVETINKLHSKD